MHIKIADHQWEYDLLGSPNRARLAGLFSDSIESGLCHVNASFQTIR